MQVQFFLDGEKTGRERLWRGGERGSSRATSTS